MNIDFPGKVVIDDNAVCHCQGLSLSCYSLICNETGLINFRTVSPWLSKDNTSLLTSDKSLNDDALAFALFMGDLDYAASSFASSSHCSYDNSFLVSLTHSWICMNNERFELHLLNGITHDQSSKTSHNQIEPPKNYNESGDKISMLSVQNQSISKQQGFYRIPLHHTQGRELMAILQMIHIVQGSPKKKLQTQQNQ